MSNHLSIDDIEILIEEMTAEEWAIYSRVEGRKAQAELEIVDCRKRLAAIRKKVRARLKKKKETQFKCPHCGVNQSKRQCLCG